MDAARPVIGGTNAVDAVEPAETAPGTIAARPVIFDRDPRLPGDLELVADLGMNEIGRHVLLGRGGRRAGTGAAELIGALDLEIGLARLGVGEDADARRIEMPVPGGIIGRIDRKSTRLNSGTNGNP